MKDEVSRVTEPGATTLLYCECGYVIWMEVWRRGAEPVVVFFDDEETSETYAEQVVRCPGCGEGLSPWFPPSPESEADHRKLLRNHL